MPTPSGGEESTLSVSRFSGGDPVRTIISGSDQLRLTFHSDYRGERRGFGLTFQPVRVAQVGARVSPSPSSSSVGENCSPRPGTSPPQTSLSSTLPGQLQYEPCRAQLSPSSSCSWSLSVPGPATVRLVFHSLALHSTDTIEVGPSSSVRHTLLQVRDGPGPSAPFITSVAGNSFPPVRSLTGALHLTFRSNE